MRYLEIVTHAHRNKFYDVVVALVLVIDTEMDIADLEAALEKEISTTPTPFKAEFDVSVYFEHYLAKSAMAMR